MYTQNAEILQGIYKQNFFDGFMSGNSARFYSGLSKNVPQDQTTVTYTSFGSVPEPAQLSGIATAAGVPRAKVLNDYKMAVTVQEHQVAVGMARSVAEDNPADAGSIVTKLGGKANFYYDRQFMACLTSATLLGYDGKVVYSATHGESGTSQDNTGTSAGTPTGAQIETAITAGLGALMGFTDDQGTPVNEGVTSYTILVNPLQYFTYRSVLDPTMSNQAVDSSGGTGVYRGMFTIIPSKLVTTKVHYIFANGSEPAVGFFHKTDWDLTSNMFTASDEWTASNRARFSGYARFNFYPWQWKSTVKYTFS
jgi:hypothetical protein